jgi:hypothetical protein
MRTRIISIIACAISGGLLASCHHKRTRTVIHRTEVLQKAASLPSLSGKTIAFDYSQAKYRYLLAPEDFDRDPHNNYAIVYHKNVPWEAYAPREVAMTRAGMKFNGDSCVIVEKLYDGFAPTFRYTYRKSGESSAIINGEGIGREGVCEYILTFETPRSGTATFEASISDGRYEVRNIRFSIN